MHLTTEWDGVKDLTIDVKSSCKGEGNRSKRARKILVGDGGVVRKAKGGRRGGEGEGSGHSSGGELGGKRRPQLGEQALV